MPQKKIRKLARKLARETGESRTFITAALVEKFFKIVMRDFTTFGGALFYGIIMLAALAMRRYEFFWRLLAGVAIIYAATIAVKVFYFKDRPERMRYRSFVGKIEASSFPSVHSARAFLLAALISDYYSTAAMSIVVYAAAAMVCYSRIYLRKHDIIDVAAGAALGLLIGGAMFWILGPLPFP